VNAAQRHQLLQLDRALLCLLDERARLVAETGARETGGAEPAIDDLLRRHDGPFPAADVRAVFESVRSGCEEAAQ